MVLLRPQCQHNNFPCNYAVVPGTQYCGFHKKNEPHRDPPNNNKGYPVLFRFNSHQKDTSHVPMPGVIPYCFVEGFLYGMPDVVQIRNSVRVIVCTCAQAGVLYEYGLDRGYFSHIFVDEAGQATEPETAIPLSFATKETCVVLAGDHLQ
eukprot:gene12156-497_t